MNISLIAAMDRNNAIGIGNTLPWHIPTDMQHFRKTTTGKPILMGRKTFDSMGKALPHRTNIVLTRDSVWTAPDTLRVGSIEEAVRQGTRNETLWVIGGAQVYEQALPLAKTLVLTRLDLALDEADAYFPTFSEDEWECANVEHFIDPKTSIALAIEIWNRKTQA